MSFSPSFATFTRSYKVYVAVSTTAVSAGGGLAFDLDAHRAGEHWSGRLEGELALALRRLSDLRRPRHQARDRHARPAVGDRGRPSGVDVGQSSPGQTTVSCASTGAANGAT